jgi:hypothetical protein
MSSLSHLAVKLPCGSELQKTVTVVIQFLASFLVCELSAHYHYPRKVTQFLSYCVSKMKGNYLLVNQISIACRDQLKISQLDAL